MFGLVVRGLGVGQRRARSSAFATTAPTVRPLDIADGSKGSVQTEYRDFAAHTWVCSTCSGLTECHEAECAGVNGDRVAGPWSSDPP